MMVINSRFPGEFSVGFAPIYESEGSGSSGRVDMEIAASDDSSAPTRKCINLNSAPLDSFGVPIQILPLSKISLAEKENLVLKLRADLDQIRVLQKRVELQRMNVGTVSSSSDILSCNHAEKGPLARSFQKSSVSTCGPGKKVHMSRGWNRGSSGKFESAKQALAPSTLNTILMKQCETLLKKLMSHQYGWVFNTPVDPVKLNIPDYFNVIKHPMDLGTIKGKLASYHYSSPLDFLADVRLTFSNAMTYNLPGSDVYIMANSLSKFFEVRWKVIEKKVPVNDSQPIAKKSEIHEKMGTIEPMPTSKKRKITCAHNKVVPEHVKQIMTYEAKQTLSRELEALDGDLPDNIVEFLREKSSNGTETREDEIEIDIDDLSDDTLFTLRRLLDDFLQEKRLNHEKDEPCEIELLNESGLSNSSMQLCKGNDPLDEDVGVGGSEPPFSNCPPVKIDDDPNSRRKKYSESSSSECRRDGAKGSSQENSVPEADLEDQTGVEDLHDGNQLVSELDQMEQNFQPKPDSVGSDCLQDGESTPTERQYRAALLKIRFADTILKAREKNLNQGEKGDPEKLRREKEELEMQRRKDKARSQAEAKAAEDAQRQAEAEAAAEAKRKRELEREAARQALLKIEKTVEINENSRFLKDLEMLRTAPSEQIPSSVDETSPDHPPDAMGSFKLGGSNPLEQLGLYMKVDEEEEEGEAAGGPNSVNDVEEGEID